MDFSVKIFHSHHCCPLNCTRDINNSVHCPDGEVLNMMELCGDRCYHDWEDSKVLDPLNANYRCHSRAPNFC